MLTVYPVEEWVPRAHRRAYLDAAVTVSVTGRSSRLSKITAPLNVLYPAPTTTSAGRLSEAPDGHRRR